MRIKAKIGVILLACSFLLLTMVGASADRTEGFTDVSGNWAEEVIYEAQAAGFVTGYGDGQFKPAQSLSRVEALVMINHGLGWTGEKVSTGDLAYPADLWSGYQNDVAIAVSKGLLESSAISSMQFNQPAPRIEVATWLAKALNLNGDITSLKFTDLAGMSEETKAYLAGVVGAGYLSGYPDNTFKPEGSLTRAEMCSIMSRMLQSGKMQPEEAKYIQGTLEKIDEANFSLRVEGVDYPLADAYVIFQDGSKSGFLKLAVDSQVRLVVDLAGKALFVATAKGAASGNAAVVGVYKGYVVDKYSESVSILLEDGSMVEFYSDQIEFAKDGFKSSFNAAVQGTPLEVTKTGGNYTKVNLKTGTRKVFGYITSIKSSLIGINDFDDQDVSYSINEDLPIYDSEGDSIKWSNLDEEMGVEIWLDNEGKASEIHVSNYGEYLYGTVNEVKLIGSKNITLENSDGDEETFAMAEEVYVDNNGTAKKISELQTDMDVFVLLNAQDQVIRIKILVESTKDITGEITDIKTSGDMYIVVKQNGNNRSYDLAKDVTVTKSDQDKPLSYLTEGMTVELTLDRNEKVTKINVRTTSTETISGEITYLKTTGNYKLEMDVDGERQVYYFSDAYKIKIDGEYEDIDSLRVGMKVKLTLDSEEEITLLEKADTTESYTVKGSVISVKTSGTYKLTIEKTNGDSRAYYFAESYTIVEDGTNKKISYLAEGMEVTLTINNSEEIKKVLITDSGSATSVSGEITYLKTSGTYKLTLEKTNGSEVSYYFANDYVIRDEDNKTRGIAYLEEGMNVTLTLDDSGDITLVKVDSDTNSQITGEITYVKTSGTYKLTLKKNSKETTYNFANSYKITEDGVTKKIGYLEEGMKVTITLNSDEEISKVIIDDSNSNTEEIYGTITYLKTSGTKKITIEKTNGREVTYGISDDVEVYEGNRTRSLGYLEEDMDVNIIINSNDEVIEIEIK